MGFGLVFSHTEMLLCYPFECQNAISDPFAIANHFNTYFAQVGPTLAQSIQPSATYPGTFMGQSLPWSMFVKPVHEGEILDIISSLKDSAAGCDGIKPTVLKAVKHEILQPLVSLVNMSLKQGIFPDALKTAVINPVHKKGVKSDVRNYRPISVLNVISKVFERIIRNRLLSYLNRHQILYKNHCGFRKHHSTDLAIQTVVDSILEALDKKMSVIGVFMDLSKAFDTINHSILLYKLSHYGIHGAALDWFKSFLHKRQQMVEYNNVMSEKIDVLCGVPQGSILGPILFF